MDFTHSTNAQRISKRTFQPVRFFAGLLAFLFLFILLLLILAPTLLSTTFARQKILAIIQPQLPPAAELSVEAWSFAWFSKQEIRGIRYTDPSMPAPSTIRTITLNSLWQLLPIGKLTADITIEQPILHLPCLPIPPPATESYDSPSSSISTEAPKQVALPTLDVALNLSITDATLTCPQFPEPVIQKGSFTFTLPSIESPIQTTLSAMLLDVETSAAATLAAPTQLLTAPMSLNTIHQLTLSMDAPWVKLDLESNLHKTYALPSADLSFSINTATLFSHLQTASLLPSEFNSLSGQLAIATRLTPLSEQLLSVASTVTSKDLTCVYDNKRISYSPTLSLDLFINPKNPLASTINHIKAQLPGLNITGTGSMDGGLLQATFQALPFWSTFAPFIGDYPFQQPFEMGINIQATKPDLNALLVVTSEETQLARVTLRGEEIDPQAQTVKQLKLNSQWFLEPLFKVLGGISPTTTVKGEFNANLAAAGALDNLKANLAFALHNAQITSTSWQIHEPSLLEGATQLSLSNSEVTLSNLNVTTPISTLNGAATLSRLPSLKVAAQLKGDLTPGLIFNKWRKWGKQETPFGVNGSLHYTINLEQPSESLICTTTLSSETFSLLPQADESIALPFNLNLVAQYAQSLFRLDQCTFSTPALELASLGTFDLPSSLLALNGTLTPDFDAIFNMIPTLKENRDTFAISGKHSRNFSLNTPLSNGLLGILNYGSATAELHVDTITVPGLDIPHGDFTLQLQQGVASVDGKVRVNDGWVHLQPRFNLTTATPTLSWEKNAKILEEVKLTQQLLDAALSSANPILAGAANPSGTLSLTCETLHAPLTERLVQDLEASLLIQTRDCQLKPSDTLQKVLTLISKKDDRIHLEDQDIAIQIGDGVIQTSPIHFMIDTFRISCEGQTNLITQAINYLITLPLNEKLLGKSLAKSVKQGETITLSVTGTIPKPILNADNLTKVFADASVKKAKEKFSKKLDKVLQKRSRKSDSSSSNTSDALEDALRNLLGN